MKNQLKSIIGQILVTYGYCDDNNKGQKGKHTKCIESGLDDLIELIMNDILKTSQFSLATRIARNGPKSEIHILNLIPQQIIALAKIKFYCFEWSMDLQRPVKKEMKVKASLRRDAEKFAESIEQLNEAKALEFNGNFKLLGITKNLYMEIQRNLVSSQLQEQLPELKS